MTTPKPPPKPTLTLYPDYCHSLSPTLSRWCPLRAIDIHSLRSVGMFLDGRELFHFANHPIKWARLTGVVVAIDEYPERRVLTVDDSSGACIECACAGPPAPSTTPAVANPLAPFRVQSKPAGAAKEQSAGESKNVLGEKAAQQPSTKSPHVPWEALDVGSVVKIKGQVGKWWDVKQIDVVKLDIVGGTEGEVKCWDETLAFRRDVLLKPWVVSPEEEERCRREKERSQRKSQGRRRLGVSDGRRDGEERKRRRRDEKTVEPGNGEREKATKGRRGREEGLDPKDRVNYPSMAARRRITGK